MSRPRATLPGNRRPSGPARFATDPTPGYRARASQLGSTARRHPMRSFSFPLGSLILLAACGSDPKPVAQAPEPTPPPLATGPAPQPEKPGDVPTRSNINISDDIRKACGIADADAHFAYD